MQNALSIDVEEWFCANNMAHIFPFHKWKNLERRVMKSTEKVLSIFKNHKVKGTFFVLGWVAEQNPELVPMIEKEGHEIATHGYSHKLLTGITEEEFRHEIQLSMEILNEQSNQLIIGHRAPSFSITSRSLWAIDILKSLGFKYDSSVFPIGTHPDYGIPDAPVKKYMIKDGFWEFPMTVVKRFKMTIPVSGGGYFRFFPYKFVKKLLQSCNGEENRSFVFYLHPWELDNEQPRINMGAVKNFRHYNNIEKTESKLNKLLSDFEFTTIKQALGL